MPLEDVDQRAATRVTLPPLARERPRALAQLTSDEVTTRVALKGQRALEPLVSLRVDEIIPDQPVGFIDVDISLRGTKASKSSSHAATSRSSGNRTRSNRSKRSNRRNHKLRPPVDRSGRRR